MSGIAGSLLFGAIGFALAIPFLLRLRRKSGSWRLPGAVLAVMVAVFSLSAFVVGPAITGSDDDGRSSPASQPTPAGPEAHHR